MTKKETLEKINGGTKAQVEALQQEALRLLADAKKAKNTKLQKVYADIDEACITRLEVLEKEAPAKGRGTGNGKAKGQKKPETKPEPKKEAAAPAPAPAPKFNPATLKVGSEIKLFEKAMDFVSTFKVAAINAKQICLEDVSVGSPWEGYYQVVAIKDVKVGDTVEFINKMGGFHGILQD